MKLLILGDSLAFPRYHKNQKLEDCWPVLLQKSFSNALVWNRARSGSTVLDVQDELKKLVGFFGDSKQFDFVMLQVGIVDCCPRSNSEFDRAISKYLLDFPKFGVFLHNKYLEYSSFVRKKMGIDFPKVSLVTYSRNLKKVIQMCMLISKQIVLVTIPRPCKYLVVNEPGVLNLYFGYNHEMIEVARTQANCIFLIDWPDNSNDFILEDGHHLSNEGHQYLARQIISKIKYYF
jgi:hypothetical protein